MPPREQRKTYLRQLIIHEHFQDLDLTEQHLVDELALFIHDLQVSVQSLRVLQILIMGYGLPIIIYAAGFYQRAKHDLIFVRQNSHSFLKLANLSIQWTDNQPIQSIQFMFQFGKPVEKPKPIKKTSADLLLIKLVQEIQASNRSLRNCTDPEQVIVLLMAYRENVAKIKSKELYDFDLLMRNCIERLLLNEQQMKALEFPQHIENIQKIDNQQTSILDNSLLDLNSILSDHHPKKQEARSNSTVLAPEINHSNTKIQEQKLFKFVKKSDMCEPLSTPKKIVENQREMPLCCRKFFLYQQIITVNQDQTLAFLGAPYPFKKEKEELIRRIICSFLNQKGGILFIGFSNENKKWVATGSFTLENQKASIKKSFRQICQTIEPDILTQKMYEIQFIPLWTKEKTETKGYAIRVIVKYGARDQIYSYKQNSVDRFPFRWGEKVVEKQGRELIEELNKRVLNPQPVPRPLHSNHCQKPHVFNTSIQSAPSGRAYQTPSPSTEGSSNFKIKPENQSYPSLFQQSPHSKQRYHEQFQIKPFKLEEDQQKGRTGSKKNTNFFESPSDMVSQRKQNKWSYIYCPSLTKNQINPIFERKGLEEKVKVEQLESVGIIIKIPDEERKKIVHKICLKLEEKYSERGIKFHEVSLAIQVAEIEKVLSLIKNLRISWFQVKSKKVKFNSYKDCLQTFTLCAKLGLRCRFLTDDH